MLFSWCFGAFPIFVKGFIHKLSTTRSIHWMFLSGCVKFQDVFIYSNMTPTRYSNKTMEN